MGLRAEVVDLVGLQLVEQAHEPARVAEVAVVQEQAHVLLVADRGRAWSMRSVLNDDERRMMPCTS